MKKLLCITLAAVMCMSFVACQNSEEPATIPATEEQTPKEIEYTVYYSSDEVDSIDSTKATTQKLDLKSASELNIEVPMEKKSVDDSMDGKKITFELFGKETSAVYNSNVNYELSNSKNDFLKNQATIYKYAILDSNEERKLADVYFTENSNKPIEYFAYSTTFEKGNITEEEALVKANDFLTSYIGKEFFEDHVFSSSKTNQTFGSFMITYILNLHGFNASERIKIEIDTAGNIVSFNLSGYGTFDACKNELTKERLDAALEKLNAIIPQDGIKPWYEVVMDYQTGIPYLMASHSEGDFYINIY